MAQVPLRRLVARPVAGLPTGDDATEVVRALAHLAGPRRLSALAGGWSGTALLVTADPRQVLEDPAGSTPDLARLRRTLDDARAPVVADRDVPDSAVGGGWVTLLGHALGRVTGRVRTPPVVAVGPRLPTVLTSLHDHVLRFDGERWWAEALDDGDGAATARADALADAALTAVTAVSAGAGPSDPGRSHAPWARLEHVPDARAHMAAVEQVVTAVRGGDIAQANVCTRFGLRLPDGRAGAVAAWVALVRGLRPGRAALVTGPWGALVGASPELYLAVGADRVRSAPIKGTRPDGEGRALLASAKDSSENVMIVDLVRNDLSRVCRPGTVQVDELLAVRTLTGVTHLVSQVSGRPAPGTGVGDLVAATFPPGSVTGTPKQRATEVTDAVEPAARGAHTGAVGWVGPRLADLAVTIRSLEVGADGTAALGVGGGIVADSTPAEEWHEVLTKAAPLLRALGVDPPAADPSTAARKGVAEASAGLLETVLAVDGRAVEAAEHAARLHRSTWELTGRPVTADVVALLDGAAGRAGPGAHRLRVRQPLTPGAHAAVEVEPFVRPVPLDRGPGLRLGVAPAPTAGLERHKFADRRWVDAALARGRAGTPDADDVALRTAAGELLETTRACLLAVLPAGPDGRPTLLTPPCDGRVLPGVTRQQVVDLARQQGWVVRLGPLDEAVLAGTDTLLTANALRGLQWVAAVGGHRWSGPSGPAVRLSRSLLARWRLLPPDVTGSGGPPVR